MGGDGVEYLFLDLEWNQSPGTIGLEGREPIQIGVLGADKLLQRIKIFSKAIRLNDPGLLSEETIKITHTSAANVIQGKSEEIILRNFSQTFPQYHYIVVWSRDTYNLFIRGMKNFRITMRRHRVIVLQDVLGITASEGNAQIGFERALKCAEVEYVSNYLHYSKHDVNYLYELFKVCYRQYNSKVINENCILNTATGKLHTDNCRCIKNLTPERRRMESKGVVYEGFAVCKICGSAEVWNRLKWNQKRIQTVWKREISDLKKTPLTEKKIEAICKSFQVSYSIGCNAVFVRTAFARWIIYLQGNKVVKLLHENYRPCKSEYVKRQKLKCIEGYHKQKLPSENFYEVVRYIKSHDAGSIRRLTKKSRLEKLLEMVEMELKGKEEVSG